MPEVQSVKQLAAGMCVLSHAFKCLTQFIRAFIQLITRVLCLQDEGVFKRDGHASRWNPLRMDISCLCHIYEGLLRDTYFSDYIEPRSLFNGQ